MQTPTNPFKQALRDGVPQIGLWLGLADGYVAEILAGIGYDWLLVDGEHAPNDVRSVLAQLQGIASAWSALPNRSHAIVRVPIGDSTLIKQYLDLGAQTLLVPMVETAAQAADLVRAMRYPPDGYRGMGSALARASRWQSYPRYVHEANAQVCLLVQVETAAAMHHLDAIVAVDGVDGVFIGPADLSASMGHVGMPGHPEVQEAIAGGIVRIRKAGKAAGILSTGREQAEKWLAAGATFVAVGVDTILLAQAARELLQRHRHGSDGSRALPNTY